ncbi:MAG: hypothetical protein Q4C65_08455 [Eubacteriales bacterium]|nr:hypothetical protein [Eubacteriales bacterium]
MKKKMAIILSLVLACSMSMTAIAAPSPSLVTSNTTPGTQIIVDDSVAVSNATVSALTGVPAATQTSTVNSDRSAVLEGTSFRTAAGQTVDAQSVALVVAPALEQKVTETTDSYRAALTSPRTQIYNHSGRAQLNLTNREGKVRILDTVEVSLRTSDGQLVSHNGSVSFTRSLAQILGDYVLAEGETVQALCRRADGSWVAVPVVIRNGVVAVGLASFSGIVDVIFTAVVGTDMTEIPAVTSPRT